MPHPAHPTQEKIQTVQELSDLFQKAKGVYLADFTGLNVEQVNELRRNFHKQQVVYKVVKNTLIRQACKIAGYQDLIPVLEGPTALAISLQDGVLPVRLIADFTKGKEKQAPVIKAGMLEGTFISADQISLVQNIPSREVLLAQILFLLQSPVANFVGVLNEIVRSFLAVLEALVQKKQADSPPAAEASPPTESATP